MASAVPVPGLDWAVDAALLSRLIPAINAHFGLTPEQLDRLEEMLARGDFDLVAVGRAILQNPGWVDAIRDGKAADLAIWNTTEPAELVLA